MQLTKNFILQEFVSKQTYQQFGERSVQFLDMRMVQLAQFYADYFGKRIIVNNWNTGGTFSERGFRDPVTCMLGAPRSQHKFGRAFDCNVDGMSVAEVYTAIINNQKKFYDAGLRCLEDIQFTTGWIHSDSRDTSGHGMAPGQILIVKP